MKGFSREAAQIMIERFGKDTIIALATTENEIPYVRYVNAYYENGVIAEKLKKVFAGWIDNGHTDFNDENTIILCIQLTEGILFSHGTRYDIDFFGN